MNIGEIFLGDLVLDKNDRVVQVKSLSCRKVLFDAWYVGGPEYRGLINGEPANNFRDCPVTLPLLEALGWQIETLAICGLAYAWPGRNQFLDFDAKDFEVLFILADGVLEHYRSGEVLYRDADSFDDHGNKLWEGVTSMVELGWAFYRLYTRRMLLELPASGEYSINHK